MMRLEHGAVIGLEKDMGSGDQTVRLESDERYQATSEVRDQIASREGDVVDSDDDIGCSSLT